MNLKVKNHFVTTILLFTCTLIFGQTPKYTAAQDSIIETYLNNGAYKYHYTLQGWDDNINLALKKDSTIALLWQLKALPLWKSKKYELALRCYDKAVLIDRAKYLGRRGYLKCIFQKDYKGAIADMEMAQKEFGYGFQNDHSYSFYISLCHLQLNEFEKAELVRKKIEYLENYQSRSVVAGLRAADLDIFYLLKEQEIAYVNYLMVRNGSIIQTQTNKVDTPLDETPEEVLVFSIARLRATFNSDAREVVVPFPIEFPEGEVEITVPKGGDKKKLLELAEKNARYFIDELLAKERLRLNSKEEAGRALLEQLQEDLTLSDLPVHIECFDNSNFQGSYPVSAMVCFRNAQPYKKDYRHFNVKTVEGINDFATMKEAVGRRYKRLSEEGKDFPQLVIIDGGKGQLSAANEAIIELGLEGRTTLVGLAKNEEEIFFTGDTQSLKLPYNSPTLHLLRRIRDEVHRFGITFHRAKRSKGTFKNELEDIPGIGETTANTLLQTFRSVKKVREASLKDLAKVVGQAKALAIMDYFEKKS